MFDFLLIGYQKRLKNRLNVRSFVRYFVKKLKKRMKIAYLQVFVTLIMTIYGQIIIKSRIKLYGAMPDGLSHKTIFLLKLFLDPLILSGFISAFFASLFWMSAMTKLPLTRAYPIMAMAPSLVLIFGIMFLGETITYGKILGTLIIILGTIISVKL